MVDLERAIGEVLFNRLPRGYELTETGQELVIKAQAVEDQILSITLGHAHNAQLPIHISAGTWMTRFLSAHINDLASDGARLIFRAT